MYLQVKFWITLNEPWIVAMLGYGVGGLAPGNPVFKKCVYVTESIIRVSPIDMSYLWYCVFPQYDKIPLKDHSKI